MDAVDSTPAILDVKCGFCTTILQPPALFCSDSCRERALRREEDDQERLMLDHQMYGFRARCREKAEMDLRRKREAIREGSDD